MANYNKLRGFTLPEMMITLGMISIILSMAVPSVSNMIRDNKLTTHLNNVVMDVHFARSEAVKRDVRVIICRSTTVAATVPACGGTNYDWSTGYIIFADDGRYLNNTYDAATDTLLRRGMPSDADVRLRTNDNWNDNLEINPNGSTNGGGMAVMSLCDDRGTDYGKQIQVTNNGIPKLFAGNISDCTPGT
ncbi:MAG: GspH/FimT family pseudopilin [Gammaproteobacteria bacterium]|nr:GspH/FimT family pseudopilin [Gammaproteobacteria bacterium]